MYPRTNLKGIIFLLVLLVVWEVVGRTEIIDPPEFLPPFSEVLVTFYALTMALELPYHALLTVARGLAGMFLAAVLAIPIGLWMGASRTTNELLTPVVELLRPIPPAAVIPVSILFLGIGDTMKLAVIAFGSVWPILVNTTAGVQNLDKTLVDTGRMLHLGPRRFLWEIVFKGASPYIATGMRISLAISLILAIVTEMIAGSNGLGFFIMLSERSFQIKEMYAGLLGIAAIGYALNHLYVFLVYGHLMRWYQGYTAEI